MFKTRKRNGQLKNKGWMWNSQAALIEGTANENAVQRQILFELQQANAMKARELVLLEYLLKDKAS